MQRFITCRFLDVANTMLEITDFCPKLRFFSILITDFNFQRLAALQYMYGGELSWWGVVRIRPQIGHKGEVLCKRETHPVHIKDPITFVANSRIKTQCDDGAPAFTIESCTWAVRPTGRKELTLLSPPRQTQRLPKSLITILVIKINTLEPSHNNSARMEGL